MYENIQKLIFDWNAIKTLMREGEEEKDADAMASIHIAHFVKKMAEKLLCVIMCFSAP
jgi:hypothetical protein